MASASLNGQPGSLTTRERADSEIVARGTPAPPRDDEPPHPVGNPDSCCFSSFVAACAEFFGGVPIHRDPAMLRRLPGVCSALDRMGPARVVEAVGTVVASAARSVDDQLIESTGPLGTLRRLADVTPSYPVDRQGQIGNGVVVDATEYTVPFCASATCSGAYLDALSEECEPPFHFCVVYAPRRCPACDPRFWPRGHIEQDFEARTLYIPSAWARQIKNLSHYKNSHDKKNVHLGVVAYLDKDMGLREEAFLSVVAKLAQLAATPARCFPRWGTLPLIRWFTPSWPMRAGYARFATHFLPGEGSEPTDQETAGTLLAKQQAALDEDNGGIRGRIVDVDLEEAKAKGLTNLPDPSGLAIKNGRSVDGKHSLSEKVVAVGIAPIAGRHVIYDDRAVDNGIAAAMNRIGGPEAEARKFRWQPDRATIDKLAEIDTIVIKQWLTPARVKAAAIHLGIVDFMCQPKLSPDHVRGLVDEVMAGYDLGGPIPAQVKKEVTLNPDKFPRLVMDQGLPAFVATAFAMKTLEYCMGKLDAPLNIKGRDKAAVIDEISEDCSFDAIYGLDGLDRKRYPPETAAIGDSDFGKFEFSQGFGPAAGPDVPEGVEARDDGTCWIKGMDVSDEFGLLAGERRIICHMLKLLPDVLNELCPQTAKLNLGSNLRSVFKGKVKGNCFQSLFKKATWHLGVWMAVRLSGTVQTSFGNRYDTEKAQAVAHLDRPKDLFLRLIDLAAKPAAEARKAKHWTFQIKGRMVRWRPWAEGDDFLFHCIGVPGVVVGVDASRVDMCQRAIALLNSMGLDTDYHLMTKGRAEFVGIHCMTQGGFTIPGAWVPKIENGLVKSAIGTSPAMFPDAPGYKLCRALAFETRAAMFRGRCDPFANMYEQWADEIASDATEHECQCTHVTLDWNTASEIGKEYGARVNCRDTIARLRSRAARTQLSMTLQHQLCEESLGGAISNREWSVWNGGGIDLTMLGDDAIAVFPAALRAKLGLA